MWRLLVVAHHLAKFNSHRPCASRDITYLIYDVTLQDHVIKGFSDFLEESSSLYVTNLPSLVAAVIMLVRI